MPYRFEGFSTEYKDNSLHGDDYNNRAPFLKVVNEWAANNGYPDVNILKDEWKR